MAKGRGADAVRVPMYVDLSQLPGGVAEAKRLARQRGIDLGRGTRQVNVEMFDPSGQRLLGPSGRPLPSAEVKRPESGQAMTRAMEARRAKLLRSVDLLEVEGKITSANANELKRLSNIRGKQFRTLTDLNEELDRQKHIVKIQNARMRRDAKNMPTEVGDTADATADAQRLRKRRRTRQRLEEKRDKARQAEEDAKLGMSPMERYRSRQMMGFAGIATAATMPISGFTPLTIGFASMSGIGFGIGAAGAVFIRALIDSSKALNKAQDNLLSLAESSDAVSDRFKEQQASMRATGAVQGFLVGEQTSDRLEKWNAALDKNIGAMSVANEAWGQLRMDLSDFGRAITMSILGVDEDAPFGKRGNYQALGNVIGYAIGGTLGSIIGSKKGGQYFGEGLEAFAGRKDVIAEQLANARAGNFNAQFVKPEDVFNRMQQRLSSRKDKDEKFKEQLIKKIELMLAASEKAAKHVESLDNQGKKMSNREKREILENIPRGFPFTP